MKRRTFIKSAGAATLISSISLPAQPFAGNNLKILVLGGRDFLGPAMVKAATGNGHQVTLFNRNLTNPHLFTELPLVKGDREQGKSSYAPLKEKHWDVIIDVWPQESTLVDEATEALKDHTDHYLFISSIAVYADYRTVGLTESAAVVHLPENKSDWGYSEEKVLSEQLVADRFPKNHTILRPGPIKGWRDPAVDVAYWLLRFQSNQQVLAPGTGNDPIQFIDVKDIGRFAIKCVEDKHFGIFNTTGPQKETLSFREFLESCKSHTGSNAEIVWVEESFLKENEIRSFDDMPLWIPLHEDPGFMQISNSKADQHGFRHSPLTATYNDILTWYQEGLGGTYQFGREHNSVGLPMAKEQEVLAKWQAR